MTTLDWSEITGDLRDVAEEVMVDLAELYRPSDAPPTLDEGTGQMVSPAATFLWAGKCRILPFAVAGIQPMGEQRVTLATLAARLPFTVTDIEPGDYLTVTASADPRLVGRSLTVESVGASSAGLRREVILTDDQG